MLGLGCAGFRKVQGFGFRGGWCWVQVVLGVGFSRFRV